MSPQFLYQFAAEAAWKEDHRRLSIGELRHKKVALAMAHPVSRVWAGDWQRNISTQYTQQALDKTKNRAFPALS